MLSDVMSYFGLSCEFDQAGYFETEHHQYLVKEIAATIKKGRIITLTGIVGCGKTKLIQHIRKTLIQEKAGKPKPETLLAGEAIDLLAERLSTPLQIGHYLTLAFEEAFHIGQKPVTAEFVNRVLAISLNDPEPHLIRHGYNVKSLAQLINIRPAEIRAVLYGQLPPVRAQELKDQLLKAGVPL